MNKQENICQYCCWHDEKGFCLNKHYWNYDHEDKSCKTILGCKYFVKIEQIDNPQEGN